MKKRLVSAMALAALAVPSFAFAAEEVVDPNTGAVTFGLDTAITTAYFFRGANQEDGGLIIQPNLYASFGAVDTDDVDVSLKVGTWNSFHSQQTASTNVWYESDLYALATVTLSNGFSFNVGYTAYFYPGGAFSTIQELGVSTVYDYTKLLPESVKGLGGNIELGVYHEVDDGNGSEDTYGEIIVRPSYSVDAEVPGLGKPTITFPIKLGVSLNDYFLESDGGNSFFGYLSASAVATVPLSSIPAKYGSWTLSAGVEYLHLFADSLDLANNDEDNQFIGTVGLSIAY